MITKTVPCEMSKTGHELYDDGKRRMDAQSKSHALCLVVLPPLLYFTTNGARTHVRGHNAHHMGTMQNRNHAPVSTGKRREFCAHLCSFRHSNSQSKMKSLLSERIWNKCSGKAKTCEPRSPCSSLPCVQIWPISPMNKKLW